MRECHKCPLNGSGSSECIACASRSPREPPIATQRRMASYDQIAAAMGGELEDTEADNRGASYPPEMEPVADLCRQLASLSAPTLTTIIYHLGGVPLAVIAKRRGVSRQAAWRALMDAQRRVPCLRNAWPECHAKTAITRPPYGGKGQGASRS